MATVRDNVKLHPETVAKAESLIKDSKKPSRTREPEPEIIRRYRKKPPWMNSLVWNAAMKLADGDYHRVVLNSPTEALVVNQ